MNRKLCIDRGVVALGTYYRRRCESSKVRLSLWSRNVRIDGRQAVIRWLEPEDLLTDKEPRAYTCRLELSVTPYRVITEVVPADTLVSVPATDPGLREIA
jgi:hypothetical protein